MTEFLLMVLFCTGLYVTARSLSFIVLQIELFGLRKYKSIPRFVHHQRMCDVLIICYHSITFLLAIWMVICGAMGLLGKELPVAHTCYIPIAIFIFYFCFYLFFLLANTSFDLMGTLKEIKTQWGEQATVSEYNDHEVDMYRALVNIKKLIWRAVTWQIVLLVLFFIMS